MVLVRGEGLGVPARGHEAGECDIIRKSEGKRGEDRTETGRTEEGVKCGGKGVRGKDGSSHFL